MADHFGGITDIGEGGIRKAGSISFQSCMCLDAEILLFVCKRQTIADSNHAFDPETKGLKSAPEPMYVHPETQ